jgi:dTMP kinase
MNKGLLVVLDGIDGAGKTTQVKLLLQALQDAKIEAVRSKEPTNGKWGTTIRNTAKTGRLPLDEELDLFIKDRTEHVETFIRPSLDAGKIVILDRYYYSTIAYQGARGANIQEIKERMKEIAIVPNITFILDVDVSTGINRIKTKRNETPNHFEESNYLELVKNIFLDLCKTEKEIIKINGNNSTGHVHNYILKDLSNNPFKKLYCAKKYESDCGFCGFRISKTCDWYDIISNFHPVIQKEK